MSGLSLTLIVLDKKISRKSNFFSDLDFNKELLYSSENSCEFLVDKQLNDGSKDLIIYDNFHVEYNEKIINRSYSEHIWQCLLIKIHNPKCSLDMSSMSRDLGSFYLILKHIEQLLLENYHFYVITNNINNEIKEKFRLTKDLINIEEDYYIISEKIIKYIIENKILDFIEY